MTRFHADITLEIEAKTGQLAIETARAAVSTLQSSTVVHAYVARTAVPLFDSEPFAQIPGQLDFES